MSDATRPADLKRRTMSFSVRIVRLFASLAKTVEGQVIGKQLLRSGTSVGAHYREAMRARSTAEFVSKIEGGLQELEETSYWIELLIASEIVAQSLLVNLQNEIEELTATLVTCAKNAKTKKNPSKTG